LLRSIYQKFQLLSKETLYRRKLDSLDLPCWSHWHSCSFYGFSTWILPFFIFIR